MFCFVDESGHTGLNLFDEDQPKLYYGLLTSKVNLDVFAEPLLKKLRRKLGVDRLHANRLGVSKLSEVATEISEFSKKQDVRFSLFKVAKPDHAVISFFDQVFDSGVNDAVPWEHYWTPLRYALLFKVAYLFDEDVAKKAWTARTERNSARSADLFQEVCKTLLDRVSAHPDARAREIIAGGLKWAAANPLEISYSAGNKDSALQISPNLVGFQQVLQSIAMQAGKQSRKVSKVTVDRQTEFNRAQDELAGIYRKMRGHKSDMGPGMPKMDMTNMPEVPPTFCPGDESAGLELVDLTLWIAKRLEENKPLSRELIGLFETQAKRGLTDEVSFDALDRRWSHLADLPMPSNTNEVEVRDLMQHSESKRIAALKGL